MQTRECASRRALRQWGVASVRSPPHHHTGLACRRGKSDGRDRARTRMDRDPELDVTLSNGRRLVTFRITALDRDLGAWTVVNPPMPRRVILGETEALATRRYLDASMISAAKSKYDDAALKNFERAKRCDDRAGRTAEWGEDREPGALLPRSYDRWHGWVRKPCRRLRTEPGAVLPRAREGELGPTTAGDTISEGAATATGTCTHASG